MEKTKVIWIGRKRYSKDKLNVTAQLDWGNVEFNLLGITFSVDLDTMVELNYNKAIDKVTKDVLKWQNQNLTPIGRVTVMDLSTVSIKIPQIDKYPVYYNSNSQSFPPIFIGAILNYKNVDIFRDIFVNIIAF